MIYNDYSLAFLSYAQTCHETCSTRVLECLERFRKADSLNLESQWLQLDISQWPAIWIHLAVRRGTYHPKRSKNPKALWNTMNQHWTFRDLNWRYQVPTIFLQALVLDISKSARESRHKIWPKTVVQDLHVNQRSTQASSEPRRISCGRVACPGARGALGALWNEKLVPHIARLV